MLDKGGLNREGDLIERGFKRAFTLYDLIDYEPFIDNLSKEILQKGVDFINQHSFTDFMALKCQEDVGFSINLIYKILSIFVEDLSL